MMKCDENIFKQLRRDYCTIKLFKNYYLMRNNTWSNIGPSLWGFVKVTKSKKR